MIKDGVIEAGVRWARATIPRVSGPAAALSALLFVGPASAQPAAAARWSIQPTPMPAGSTSAVMRGVSCVSRSACVAVGGFANRGGLEVTLAERWNGNSWSIQRTPNPLAARTGSILNSVSCASRSACIAVGFFQARSGPDELPLAERWHGKRWAIQRMPSPGDVYTAYMYGVSCVSTTACTAVGVFATKRDRGTGIPLVERWNGKRWSIQHVPNPAPTNSEFDGVSCTSSIACTAVGQYAYAGPGEAELTFAERWDGKRWSIQHTPSPGPGPGGLAGATGDGLRSVSCVSSSACTAVGSASRGAGPQALVERYHPTRWSTENAPDSPDAPHPELQGVSCTSSLFCAAVGSFGYPAAPLAEVRNRNGWSIQLPPFPPESLGWLSSVSCVSPRACIAVGSFTRTGGSQGQTLAETYS